MKTIIQAFFIMLAIIASYAYAVIFDTEVGIAKVRFSEADSTSYSNTIAVAQTIINKDWASQYKINSSIASLRNAFKALRIDVNIRLTHSCMLYLYDYMKLFKSKPESYDNICIFSKIIGGQQ